MRLLVEVSGLIEDWHQAFAAASDRPRLPLPFSSSSAFLARGHEISAIHFSDQSFASRDKGRFQKLYGPRELQQALIENDIAFFWAVSGVKAVASNLGRLRKKKVLLASYVWCVPQTAAWKVQGLAFATRLAGRCARGVVLMTGEQTNQAAETLRASVPVLRFTWGIDSAFYCFPSTEADVSSDSRQQISELLSKPYVILAGDQQRLDHDAIELVENFGLRLVRAPQEPHTAAWYRRQISERRLQGRLFVLERVSYPTLRFLLQHAVAYVGLVDSTWQPAGWTVLCEALASGTPSVIYDGLTVREMRRLGAGDYVITTSHKDIHAVASSCEQIRTRQKRGNGFAASARDFSKQVLDLQKTAGKFVGDVEEILAA